MSEPLSYRCPEFLRQSMASIDGDRLWVMCCLVGAANTALLVLGYLTGEQYVTALGIVFSVYSGAKAWITTTETRMQAQHRRGRIDSGDFDAV